MKAAETRGHERVAPCGRRDEGRDAQRHEEEAHDGHDAHRQCSAGGDGRAVEQQPAARKLRREPAGDEHGREHRARCERRQIGEREAPQRRPEERRARRARFSRHRDEPDDGGHGGGAEPGDQPLSAGGRTTEGRGGEGDDAYQDAAPSRHRRERSRPLHRLADEAEVVHRVRVQRGRGVVDPGH